MNNLLKNSQNSYDTLISKVDCLRKDIEILHNQRLTLHTEIIEQESKLKI